MSSNDENVLNSIMPRLVTMSGGDSVLGLEIIDGPYKGVTFSFKKFTVMRERMINGMVPTQFETKIHEAPKDFVQDEGFDSFCSEVLLSWLHFISVTSFDALIKTETRGVH